MGLSVRRYALRLELQNYNAIQPHECFDEEKASYEDEGFTDQYQDSAKFVQQSTREKDNITVIEVAGKPS
jgi:hypothetical protein